LNTLIFGLQYGDEGKGRVAAHFTEEYEWSVRFNGGPNAGHTVYNQGIKHKLHHFPAGIVFDKKVALDAGMVINPTKLLQEYNNLLNRPKLHISSRAHIIVESHLKEDELGSGIGSTKQGIAYVYSDKVQRKGRRVKEELQDLNSPLHQMNIEIYDGLPPQQSNERALYESAQAVMLDLDYGNYPFVTSSSVFPSILHNITQKIGVFKPYVTRVGEGPPNYPDLPFIRELGGEYGTTTGRPRRCTWLVVEELEYALKLTKPEQIVLTKLDVLKNVPVIKVWENNQEKTIGNFDSYCNFLFSKFKPHLYSNSPEGALIRGVI
jgi:adenylosuccinate synthase